MVAAMWWCRGDVCVCVSLKALSWETEYKTQYNMMFIEKAE